eukprot:5900323-Alexandrium_andersonii.AAC.1
MTSPAKAGPVSQAIHLKSARAPSGLQQGLTSTMAVGDFCKSCGCWGVVRFGFSLSCDEARIRFRAEEQRGT